MPGIFITGTDTACGKTIVSAALVKYFTSHGIDCGYMKPISCGPNSDNDAVYLKKLLNLKDPLPLLNPISLPPPLSPLAAARKANKPLKKQTILKKILSSYSLLTTHYSLLIVEGVGGALVPITKDYMVADLIKDLKIPAIIVARAGLGTINHTLLTIEALRRRKIRILGIIMNGYSGKELSEETNAEIINEISGVPILAKLDYRS
ncbi:dethiobiotin synthase [candidate division WOR-1 bacterium RIFOXYA12_FULL_43_27]|uniref:ATP-dependent dethiobiotin synthetase BioD n=1 Tax=candidate division WOR-1 bacterium RIFOXYC2_FULL_46_14 TaxID=1802587 RepID=A0A1F4U6U8_UNCSA|nr:MAG: dethiobiotin synthase [candidate division WOR-1 bacterium RIFOXYA12_FULL_43_27]OGC19541.1 MAG: dethiobiotin synthase [candidate division WOR-1 bacterium RIFOXYB2_FULL_46_45]OGC30529.1 MAG: dethiobiotin synthase [candidate division WOR-1 bacterium RIFOXYA2_FULL_46_56]OGC40597.1 MAG: dethiobiotin synthase [candidate division WOR-1 bacterium RIFOXYC2_FULL_46_14]